MERPMPAIPGLEVEHAHVDVQGLRMHVAAAGDPGAEPLVLLHGWPQHWYAWRRLIGPLSERYRVLCPDLRGFGWTAAPRGSYRKSELAADVVALLDSLGLDRVRLAGHDWGGFAGFLLCLDHPGRVSHFAVAGMSHPWVEPEHGAAAALKQARRLAYMALIAAPVAGGQLVRRVPAFTRAVMRASAIDPDRTWSPAELDAFVAQWGEPDRAAACVALYRTFLTRELRDLATGAFRSQTMETPCLQLVGIADPVIRPEQQAGAEANAPNLRVQTVPDAGHWLPEEAPEALLDGMLELFAGPGSPAA
ncbi:MAG: alpha/beta hydrolase [Thermoleophilia bacterium]|nr:alpha/beta hydrolase [Thermoleophilia bacterium]